MKTKTKTPPLTPIEEVRRWWHKPHWQLLLGIAFLLVAVVTIQCFYPYGKSAPTARVGDVSVANMSREQIIDVLHEKYSSVPLTVYISDADTIKTTSVAAGIVPEYKIMAEKVTEYVLMERFIPFSFVGKLLSSEPQLAYSIEQELFSEFSKTITKACARDPKDASIAFTNGRAELVPAVQGQRCNETIVRAALTGIDLRSAGSSVAITPEKYDPKLTDSDMQPQIIAAKNIINQGLSIGTPAETWPVSAEDVASWLTVGAEGELQTKPDLIKEYLDKQRGKLYIDPGTTTIRIVDGVEVSRVSGSSGQGIDLAITEARISDVLLGKTPTRIAWAQLTVLPPQEVVDRQYSPSHAGLQALVEQWDREHSGRYGIIIRDLSAAGWGTELLPDWDFVTASTFKMFLAYAVLHKVENGELSMETTTDIGLSVRECLDEMILHSTNACATSFFNLAGWSYVHNFIIEQFPSTRLDNGMNADNEKHTTVRDEVTFMHRLWAGQLMNANNTQYLLDLFKHQIYRKGIPSGVPGITVADKVGFYAGYKHDVGIVYAPSGTYILGIMSYGGNDAQFADLSRKVYDLMKQR